MADRDDPPSGPRGQDEGDRRDDKAPSRDRDRDRDRDSYRRDRSDRGGRGGYGQDNRDRDFGRDNNRDRDLDRRRDRDRDFDRPRDRDQDRPRRTRGRGGFKWKDERRGNDGRRGNEDRRGNDDRRRDDRPYRRRSQSPRRRDRDRDDAESSKPKKESKPAAAPAAPVGGGEEMIIVNINDRLGTKASIPCYASDRIKEFKILVAARIGREPHEILLKRQGERPFKDQLTLEDYGVSNGVQLDLEVDTGD